MRDGERSDARAGRTRRTSTTATSTTATHRGRIDLADRRQDAAQRHDQWIGDPDHELAPSGCGSRRATTASRVCRTSTIQSERQQRIDDEDQGAHADAGVAPKPFAPSRGCARRRRRWRGDDDPTQVRRVERPHRRLRRATFGSDFGTQTRQVAIAFARQAARAIQRRRWSSCRAHLALEAERRPPPAS